MPLSSKHRESIEDRVERYKRRFYLSALLKGIFVSIAIVLSIFLCVTLLESVFHFSPVIRTILLLGLIGAFIFAVIRFLGQPILVLLGMQRGISPEQAATQIGRYFPEVGDKLLNLIQLEKQAAQDGSLVRASIDQKKITLAPVKFEGAVDFKKSRSYARYALVPTVVIILIALISPRLIPDSSNRIIHFSESFAPEAPFEFVVTNEELQAFKNEDFTLTFRLDGKNLPQQAYLIDNERRIKLFPDQNGEYAYVFPKIQRSKNLIIEAAGFTSAIYDIQVVERPDLLGFNVSLEYPGYLGRKNERRANAGNLVIPEGTRISWTFETQATDNMKLAFGDESIEPEVMEGNGNVYSYSRVFDETTPYEISLSNEHGTNRDRIIFEAQVTPDRSPEISVDIYRDTILYNFVAFRGDLRDDYGITQLSLFTRNNTTDPKGKFEATPITISGQPNQRFYYQWDLDSLDIIPGTELEFFLQVWDNDGYNGRKASRSQTFRWKIPGDDEIEETLERIAEKTENSLDKTLSQAQQLEEKVKEAEERLRGKRDLDFQDEMYLKELLEKREELEKALEELSEQNRENLSQRDRFNKDQDKNIREKAEQLQKLMDELMDEETRRLYEELQRMLEEEQNLDEFRNNLEKLNRQESNLAKELERTLELFKRLKLEQKMNESLRELSEQIEKQTDLLEETTEKTGDKNEPQEQTDASDSDENQSEQEETTSMDEQDDASSKNEEFQELVEKQQELQEEFKDTKEKFEEIEELNQDLKRPQSLPDTEYEQKEIERSQQQSKQSLQQQQSQKSQKSQSEALEQMKEMQQKMQQMQSGMQMEVMQANMDDLRDIMHNLLTLSFDQEELITEFAEVKQSDPRFVTLGQEQLKIRDDAQIVEDSLLSLAERVFQLQSFVTREVENMNYHLDKSLEGIKERKKPNATAEQQFAMTSMNNLALLLDDVMEQMQQNMMQGQGQGQPQPMPSMAEMQEQLNQKIEDLKNSGKQGRQLSEELARLAAEQERIRQAFEEMQRKYGESEGGKLPGEGIPQDMEETELDLVNKELTQEMIERQRDILTRMLEAEDALREQDMDDERKGETAGDYEKIKPKEFDEYFELKKQEIELLRTLPPKLFPYYKKEVNDYFNRIGEYNK